MSLSISLGYCVTWFGFSSKWVNAKNCAEGVAKACIFWSGVEDGGVYLDGRSGFANVVLTA